MSVRHDRLVCQHFAALAYYLPDEVIIHSRFLLRPRSVWRALVVFTIAEGFLTYSAHRHFVCNCLVGAVRRGEF